MVLKVEKSGKNRRCAHLSTRRSQESVEKTLRKATCSPPEFFFTQKSVISAQILTAARSTPAPHHPVTGQIFFSVIFLYFIPGSLLSVPNYLHFFPIFPPFPSCFFPLPRLLPPSFLILLPKIFHFAPKIWGLNKVSCQNLPRKCPEIGKIKPKWAIK